MSITGSEQWMYSSGREFYDFPIEQSLRFNNPDQPRLTRSVTHNRKTFTINFWVKRANLGRYWLYGVYSNSATTANLNFESDGTLTFYDYLSAYRFRLVTSRVFRDVGNWYCITVSVDTTQSIASDRVKLFVNGVQETSFSTATYPSQNLDLKFGDGSTHAIGTEGTNNRLWWDGYLADWNLIDGQALDPTSFGEFKSGIFIPKDTSGLTFGSGGYRLQFGDSAAIGDDTSGNTNDWTVNNLVASDVVLDGVTNNFATWSPLASNGGTLSEGNLKYVHGNNVVTASFPTPPSGKWYWENYTTSTNNGLFITSVVRDSNFYLNNSFTDGVGYYANDGNSYIDGAIASYGATYGTGDIIGTAINVDDGEVTFYKNGVSQGTLTLPSYSGGWFAYNQAASSTLSRTSVQNFGQDSTFAGATTAGGNADENGYGDFKYAPPSGFLSLCSANLPQGAIDTLADETPEDYFSTILWTGDATNPRTLTGVGFEPSFSWLKSRSQAFSHRLYDAVRGAGNVLFSNATSAESSGDAGGELSAFTSDGFTTSGSSNNNNLNGSGYTYVGWNWKAGGTGVSNTDGSITSTVSVGATSQQNWFSIVSYVGNATAGATVGHSLGRKPDILFYKNRDDGTQSWVVYTDITGTNGFLILNSTAAFADASAVVSAPNSSTFNLHSFTSNNGSGDDIICYAFANAEGLCKVGTYTGNGSTDGPFVYTGFRPAFVMLKRFDAGNNWHLVDSERDTFNVVDATLYPNLSNSEATTTTADFLSNGFKIRASGNFANASGGTYIYLAIAEQPFKFANAR